MDKYEKLAQIVDELKILRTDRFRGEVPDRVYDRRIELQQERIKLMNLNEEETL
jgi:hypothetical protein